MMTSHENQEYHGCHWHGCRKCFPHDRNKIIDRNNQTREDRYEATMKRTQFLKKATTKLLRHGRAKLE